MKKKTVAILMAAAMIFSGVAGATVAWLTASTNIVTNTFTYGDINIELTETKPENQSAKMVPGTDIAKDPKVTVKADSEDSWVFVKIEEKNQVGTYLEYSIASGWTALEDENGVYYRDYSTVATDTSYNILSGGTGELANGMVSVKDTVTKDMFKEIGDNYPELNFTAYAVQKENIASAADAWAKINPTTTE